MSTSRIDPPAPPVPADPFVALDTIQADSLLAHIQFLADDRLEGRASGTRGCQEAAKYVADRFNACGLSPGGDFGTYYQSFVAECGRRVLESTSCTVAGRMLKLDQEFAVAKSGGKAQGSGALVLAGYGISAPEAGHDDYASLAVEGRIVVVFTGAPGRSSKTGEFLDTRPAGAKVSPRAKVEAAFGRKAAGLLLIQTPAEEKDGANTLPVFVGDPGQGLSFPAVHLTADVGREILASLGINMDETLQRLDRGEALLDLATEATATLQVDVSPIRRSTENVIGILKGKGEKSDEVIVVGAHYDHLGRGGNSSLGTTGEIHNGADDNASGTAALMELAEACAQVREQWNRTLVFVAFSGEELGLLGSLHFVMKPLFPLDKIACMLNLDMVGRSREGYCAIGSVASAREFQGLPEALNERLGLGLKLESFEGGFNQGSSDHQTFLNQKIPSLFFFSGFHEDYHRPSDDVERVNAEGAERITRMVYAALADLAQRPDRPVFVASAFTAPMTAPGSRGGDRPWFGSVPAMGDTSGEGVLFSDVRAGSPADQAGLKGGDRLIEMNGQQVKTLEDFTVFLRSAKVGDSIEVVVLRDGQRVTAKVTLAVRPG